MPCGCKQPCSPWSRHSKPSMSCTRAGPNSKLRACKHFLSATVFGSDGQSVFYLAFRRCMKGKARLILGGVFALTEPTRNWTGAPRSPQRTWAENDMFRLLLLYDPIAAFFAACYGTTSVALAKLNW